MDTPEANKERNLSRAMFVIIILALIRSIAEPFRLHLYSVSPLDYHRIRPFLLGAFTSAIMLLVMTIMDYFSRYKLVLVIGLADLVILILLKILIPF